jgi:hypothetical protein
MPNKKIKRALMDKKIKQYFVFEHTLERFTPKEIHDCIFEGGPKGDQLKITEYEITEKSKTT